MIKPRMIAEAIYSERPWDALKDIQEDLDSILAYNSTSETYEINKEDVAFLVRFARDLRQAVEETKFYRRDHTKNTTKLLYSDAVFELCEMPYEPTNDFARGMSVALSLTRQAIEKLPDARYHAKAAL